MKTIENIKRTIQKSILLIAALSIPIINGSTQVGDQKPETFLMSTIMPLNLLDYAVSLRINALSMEDYNEAEPALESWMIDSADWKSGISNSRSFLTEETEEPLQIESWMLNDFSVQTAENASNETIVEERATIENWMLYPETWGK